MKINEKALKKSKIIAIFQLCLGIAILLFFGIATLGGMTTLQPDEVGAFIVCVIFDVIGIILILSYVKRNHMVTVLNKYMNTATGLSSIEFDELSSLVAESEYTIRKNFEWLIRKNFLDDAYINYEERMVIFRTAYMREKAKAKNIKYVKRVCECCGGATKIEKGQESVCGYCGAPLEA